MPEVGLALDTPDARKARGAFFTPDEITRFIAAWAVREPGDRTLEPSCGEAAFMLAAGDRLRALGASGSLREQLHGVELHPPSAIAAQQRLEAEGFEADVQVSDFFDVVLASQYDAVIGNPPYVRYQDFAGAVRAKAREAALAVGVPLSGLASSWAAFVVQSARLVAPGGRLGLVLPAELLSVNYAAPVRRYLMERFAHVHLVMFDERVFPGALAEVVLLLAEGEGPTDHIVLSQARNLAGLPQLAALNWSPENPSRKWTPALLAKDALSAYTELRRAFVDLEQWGTTDLGMVTGNNRYFTLTEDEVKDLELPEDELLRISPPGSSHLRGLEFSDGHWRELAAAGRPTYLFRPNGAEPSDAALRYIEAGQHDKVHKAYKCKVREPWWRVPLVRTPDLLLTYMNHDTPRLVANTAGVRYLNSVHGVTLGTDHAVIGRDLLPLAALNSMTLLGAELVGRSYGGGLLKVEPKEADVLPVPSPETVAAAANDLRSLKQPVALLLQRGQLLDAVKLVDRALLVEHLDVQPAVVTQLRTGHGSMSGRRAARGGKPTSS